MVPSQIRVKLIDATKMITGNSRMPRALLMHVALRFPRPLDKLTDRFEGPSI